MSMALAEALPGEADAQQAFVHLWDLADEVETSAVRLSEIVRDGLITATRAPGVARQGAGRRRGRAPYVVTLNEADRVRRAHHRAVELGVGLGTVLRWQHDGLDAPPVVEPPLDLDAAVDRFLAEREVPLSDDGWEALVVFIEEHRDELADAFGSLTTEQQVMSVLGVVVLGFLAAWPTQQEDRNVWRWPRPSDDGSGIETTKPA